MKYFDNAGAPITQLQFWARSALRAAYRMAQHRGPVNICWLEVSAP